MKLQFSLHAREQMTERGVSDAEVIRAIRRGSTYRQLPDKFVAMYTYFSVVYRIVDGTHRIITVQPLP